MGITISGEKNATAIITISIDGSFSRSLAVGLGSDGYYSTGDLIGLLQCGAKRYTTVVRIKDAAGNLSDIDTSSFTTGDCPVCGAPGGKLALPVRPDYIITSGYMTSARPTHYGLDMVHPTNSYRANIYATGVGTTTASTHTGGVQWGKANYVTVKHDDGKVTSYWHLDNESSEYDPVGINQRVDANTLLGHMGTTGLSTGNHLHFIVKVGGETVDPEFYIGEKADIKCNTEQPREETYDDSHFIGNENDPYGGMDDDDLPWASVEFDRTQSWTGSREVKIKKAEVPAPVITYIKTANDGTSATIYGVAISKNQPMHVGVNNEYRDGFLNTNSHWEWQYKQDTAQHVRVSLYKENWTKIGELWNDNSTGRWQIQIPLQDKLRVQDKVFAVVEIYSDFWFELKKEENEKEWVKLEVKPVSSDKSNIEEIPLVWYADPAVRAIKNLELRQNNINKNGDIKTWCGTKIQEYYSITTQYGNKGGSIIIYNPEDGNAYFMTGDILWKFKQVNGWNCTYPDVTGYPKNNESVAAKSKYGTSGWYQFFAHRSKGWSSIYSSHHGVFLLNGEIRGKYEGMGGTSNWTYLGFPTADSDGSKKSRCNTTGYYQKFEGGRIYNSIFGNFSFENGEFLDSYRNRGYIDYVGWPRSEDNSDSFGNHQADFETGKLSRNVITNQEKYEDKGCPDFSGRENDGKHGAPDYIQQAIWDKEKSTFFNYQRADGYNGEIHPYCNGWVVDYKNATLLNNSRSITYNWIVYNPNTQKAYHLEWDVWDEYWNNGKGCEIYGLVKSDRQDIGGLTWFTRSGWGIKQNFDKGDIYVYERPVSPTSSEIIKAGLTGSLLSKYNSLGSHSGILGYPKKTQTTVQSCLKTGLQAEFWKGGEIHQIGSIAQAITNEHGIYNVYKNNGGFNKFGFVKPTPHGLNFNQRLYRYDSNDGTFTYYLNFDSGYVDIDGWGGKVNFENGLSCWISNLVDNSVSFYSNEDVNRANDTFEIPDLGIKIYSYPGLNKLIHEGKLTYTEDEYNQALKDIISEEKVKISSTIFQLGMLNGVKLFYGTDFYNELLKTYDASGHLTYAQQHLTQLLDIEQKLINKTYLTEYATLQRYDFDLGRIIASRMHLDQDIANISINALYSGSVKAVILNPHKFIQGFIQQIISGEAIAAGLNSLKVWEWMPAVIELISNPEALNAMINYSANVARYKTMEYIVYDTNGIKHSYIDFAREANGDLIENSDGDRAYAVGEFMADTFISALMWKGIFYIVGKGFQVVANATLKVIDSMKINNWIRSVNASELKMTQTVLDHADDIVIKGSQNGNEMVTSLSRPYMNSRFIIQEIIKGGKPIVDTGGKGSPVPGAYTWNVPGSMNGSQGTWQLVINTTNNTILHFNFVTP